MINKHQEVLLTVGEIAEVTGGEWLGDISGLKINSVTNGILNCYGAGDLHIVRNPEHWGENVPNTVARIPNVIKKGVSAIIVEEQDRNFIEKYLSLVPFLMVKNTRIALFEIARASSKKSRSIKKVQITGTEGKTSFKYFLSSLASKQTELFFQESSANMQVPILLSLANIKATTKISIIEISCPAKGLGENRSRLIAPDIAVITNVNPSHLNSHGGLSQLIENKAESVVGLKQGGYCLINHDTENFELLIKEVQRLRSDIQIKTYGNSIVSDSYVVSANFINLGWEVNASILGQNVHYYINQVQEHAPVSSIGVLMAIALLGLNVEVAAKDFEMAVSSYKSSGVINKLSFNKKETFIFYDQHFSVTESAIKSALNDVKRIKVEGKKIAVLSGEYNSDIFTENIHLRIGQYLNDSDIDFLYTVGEHIDISTDMLNNKTMHKGHFHDIKECTKFILPIIEADDILLIKGMTKLNFEYLADAIYRNFKKI